MIKSKKLLIVCFAAIILFSLLAYAVESDGFRVDIKTFEHITSDGHIIAGKLYIPPEATLETPVPAVITCISGNTVYEHYRTVNAALARNGYAVITFNLFNHGRSDVAEKPLMGLEDMLDFAIGLSFVKTDEIFMIGHVAAGSYVMDQAMIRAEDLRAVIFTDNIPKLTDGESDSLLTNTAVILSRYNEYAGMENWKVKSPQNAPESVVLQNLWGREETIEEGRLYGTPENKDARMLIMINATSSTAEFSSQMVGAVLRSLDVFGKTRGNSVNYSVLKIFLQELFCSLSTVAMYCSLYFLAMVGVRYAKEATGETTRVNPKRRIFPLFGLTVIAPISFLPLAILGKKLLGVNIIFPMPDSNGFALWGVIVGCCILLYILAIEKENMLLMLRSRLSDWRSAFWIGMLSLGACYLCGLLKVKIFHSNFNLLWTRFEVLSLERGLALLSYFIPFMVFFLGMNFAITSWLCLSRGKMLKAAMKSIAVYTMGFILIALISISCVYFFGKSVFYDFRYVFNTIYYMVPTLAFSGLLTVGLFRKKGGIVTASVISSLLLAWQTASTNSMFMI